MRTKSSVFTPTTNPPFCTSYLSNDLSQHPYNNNVAIVLEEKHRIWHYQAIDCHLTFTNFTVISSYISMRIHTRAYIQYINLNLKCGIVYLDPVSKVHLHFLSCSSRLHFMLHISSYLYISVHMYAHACDFCFHYYCCCCLRCRLLLIINATQVSCGYCVLSQLTLTNTIAVYSWWFLRKIVVVVHAWYPRCLDA